MRAKSAALTSLVCLALQLPTARPLLQTIRPTLSSPFRMSLPAESDVVIVGCGIAAVAACKKLLASGKKVLVLEAQDRIGGRMKSMDVGEERPLEMGAQWFHGVEGHPVYEHCVSVGLVSALKKGEDGEYENPDGAFSGETVVRTTGGREISPEVFGEAAGTFSEIEEGVKAGDASQLKGRAVLDVYKEGFRRYVEGSGHDAADLWMVFDWCTRKVCAIDGAEIPDQSVDQLFEYKDLVGPLTVANPVGFTKVFSSIAEGIPNGVIHTNKPIDSIAWGGGGGSGEVRVRGGETVKARHIIVTVPLGALKRGRPAFEPPLPGDKEEAIKNMGMGQVEKVFFKFSEAEWGVLQGLGFSTSLTVALSPPSASVSWVSRILGLHRYTGTSFMVVWVTGPEPASQMQQCSDASLIQQLHDFMSGLCLPEDAQKVPRASSVMRTRWTQDEYTGGSWSYIAAKSGKGDIRTLGRPEGDNLYFAGEATDPHYFGTIHGAFMSGEREAERIIAKGG